MCNFEVKSLKINRLVDEVIKNRNLITAMVGMSEEQAREYINKGMEQWVGSLLTTTLKYAEENKKALSN